MSKADISDSELKAAWLALDADSSGSISAGAAATAAMAHAAHSSVARRAVSELRAALPLCGR